MILNIPTILIGFGIILVIISLIMLIVAIRRKKIHSKSKPAEEPNESIEQNDFSQTNNE